MSSSDAAATHPLESDFGWTLGVVAKAYRRIADDAVATLPGGPRGYHILAAVSDGQPPSQLAIARQLGIDKTVLVHLLDDLENAKLVTRRPDPADRRARQIVITGKGRQTLRRAREKLDAAETALTTGLRPAELSAFKTALAQIARRTHTLADGIDDC
ncbi:MarR family winged helix-turn-helix transcriptional regulator [Gordonia sp. DT219]|uniref:MarR family winged helix-turn-helix transcriptional regulator n=1 Tax=Gordonia sp. DT219 TaxID=3416658 RepID=UPI003CEA39EF